MAIQSDDGNDGVVSVTYGGDTMTRIASAHHTGDEPMSAWLYYLGTSIETGEQVKIADLVDFPLVWKM